MLQIQRLKIALHLIQLLRQALNLLKILSILPLQLIHLLLSFFIPIVLVQPNSLRTIMNLLVFELNRLFLLRDEALQLLNRFRQLVNFLVFPLDLLRVVQFNLVDLLVHLVYFLNLRRFKLLKFLRDLLQVHVVHEALLVLLVLVRGERPAKLLVFMCEFLLDEGLLLVDFWGYSNELTF